jgi:hypothetical protein
MSGITLRPYRGRDDYAGIAAVRNRQIDFEGEGVYTTVEAVAESFDHLQRCDPASDIIVAADVDGAMVGYAQTTWADVAGGYRRYWLKYEADGRTEPDPGVETLLLDWVESRALVIASTPPGDRRLFAGAMVGTARVQRLEQRGFSATFFSVLMVRSLGDPIPDAWLPDGLTSRRVRPDDLRAIWEADIDAFRDDRDYVEQDEGDFQRFRAEAAQGTDL